jgi:hypothetical protein
MTWRGRRRKQGRRERNGRVMRRQPVAVERDIVSVAVSQPHRRGAKDPRDPFHESVLGRFVLAHKLDRFCYDAALTYGQKSRRLYAYLGIPRPCGDGRRILGLNVLPQAVRQLRDELDELDKRLCSVSCAGVHALKEMAVFERVAPAEEAEAAAAVLRELVNVNEKTA